MTLQMKLLDYTNKKGWGQKCRKPNELIKKTIILTRYVAPIEANTRCLCQ